MSRAAEALKKSGPYAPAFFLAFAVAAGGLRSPADWLLFGAVFLAWAALAPRGFSPAAPAAPLLFFAWLAAAAVFSPWPAASLGVFSRYAVFGFLFFYAVSAEEGRDPWLAAVLGLGAAAAALLVFQRLSGHGPTGFIGANPNYSAAFCAAAFPAAVLALSGAGEKKKRFIYSALALLLAAGLYAAVSRGAALAAFLSASAGLALSRRWKWLAGLLLAVLAAAALLPVSSWESLLKFYDPRAFARPRLWGAALEAAASSPLLGWGPGSFGKVFEAVKFPYFDGLSFYSHNTLHAHSELLNLAAEAGFPAALLFLASAAAALLSGGREKLPVKLCALAVLLQGGADMVFYSGAVALLFWGSLGFSAGGPIPAEVPPSGPAFGWKTALAALCLGGLALGPAAGHYGGGHKFIERAYGEARSGRNSGLALALARSSALENPKDAFIAAEEGAAFAACGDIAGAAAALGRALSLEPGFAGARLDLAAVHAAGGRREEACRELALLKKVPAGDPENKYQSALLHFDVRAAEELEKALCRKKKSGTATASPRMKR